MNYYLNYHSYEYSLAMLIDPYERTCYLTDVDCILARRSK